MFSAGEVSGDMHGANLAHAVQKLAPDSYLFGFGGVQMREAGVHLCADMADYSVMGFAEVLKNLPRLYKLKAFLTETMRREKPDILVLIDYPDFNWRLAKEAKKLGIPVFSYIPPSAWAWRKGRAKKTAVIASQIAAIFPFEIDVYREAKARIEFVGNPLLDTVQAELASKEEERIFHPSENKKKILLLPGSRKQEMRFIYPVMLEAIAKLYERRDDLEYYLLIAPGMDEKKLRAMAENLPVPIKFFYQYKYSLMNICDLAWAVSGTVVLEAALMNLPTIVLLNRQYIAC